MTPKEQKIMADLVDACRDASGWFNMLAQAQLLGLNKHDDDMRQKLCNAVSAATGQVYCGNLTRTHEAKLAIDLVNQMED